MQFAKYGIEFPTVARITLSLDLNPQFEAVRNLKLPVGNRPGEELFIFSVAYYLRYLAELSVTRISIAEMVRGSELSGL